jgi:hypothetical protein
MYDRLFNIHHVTIVAHYHVYRSAYSGLVLTIQLLPAPSLVISGWALSIDTTVKPRDVLAIHNIHSRTAAAVMSAGSDDKLVKHR